MRRIALALALVLAGTLLAAPPSTAVPLATSDRPYLAQYRQPDRTVCIQIKTSRTWLLNKVKSAEAHIDSKTDISTWVSSSCSGNKIKIYAGYYGKSWKNYSRASTTLWISNGVITRAETYINLSYYAGGTAGDYAIRHEIVHGLLGTRHGSCGSLAYYKWSGGCARSYLTSDVIKAINWTY
jgi:hypothetical protein